MEHDHRAPGTSQAATADFLTGFEIMVKRTPDEELLAVVEDFCRFETGLTKVLKTKRMRAALMRYWRDTQKRPGVIYKIPLAGNVLYTLLKRVVEYLESKGYGES